VAVREKQGSLVISVLAHRARSEGARCRRAVEIDQVPRGNVNGERRGSRLFEMVWCSFDGRSRDCPGCETCESDRT